MLASYQRLFTRFLMDAWDRANQEYLQGRLRPPVFHLADTETQLGSWHADSRTLSISSNVLMNRSRLEVEEILKHEMAHQFADEVLGASNKGETAHGAGFRRACELLQIHHNARFQLKTKAHPILDKIKKLLALADSQNPHEAELAMARAHGLMEKYELDLGLQETEFHYTFLGPPRAQKPAVQQFVASVLGRFFHVRIVWIQSSLVVNDKSAWLMEASGTEANLEVAGYVYDFLTREVARLWRKHQIKNPFLKGKSPKRDYQIGVLRGLITKLAEEQDVQSTGSELVLLKQARLQQFFDERHPDARAGSKMKYRNNSVFQAGFQEGQSLEINKGLKKGKDSQSVEGTLRLGSGM